MNKNFASMFLGFLLGMVTMTVNNARTGLYDTAHTGVKSTDAICTKNDNNCLDTTAIAAYETTETIAQCMEYWAIGNPELAYLSASDDILCRKLHNSLKDKSIGDIDLVTLGFGAPSAQLHQYQIAIACKKSLKEDTLYIEDIRMNYNNYFPGEVGDICKRVDENYTKNMM